MRLALGCSALASCVLVACGDGTLRAFEPSTSALGGTTTLGPDGEAGGGRGGTSANPAAGADVGGRPLSPLLIDDFEDGDGRAKEPLGWWYPVNDETGTQGFGIEPLTTGAGSIYALRTHGSGFQAWGAAIGVNLAGDAPSFSAVGYEELCFAAHVEAASSTLIQVHFVQGSQHYSQDIPLSESWTRYCLPLRDFTSEGQVLVPSELLALQFFFVPGAPFFFWLDDVEIRP
jgi:hypothetical protein